MPALPFKQVDVFTATPFRGNPVAVVLDARSLTSDQMHRIANWTNLSETTFVLPPDHADADYRVRIFTPQSELPFAGHPTLGTAHALIEAGTIAPKDGRLVQQCGAGLVKLTVTGGKGGSPVIAFELPQPGLVPLTPADVDEVESILGAPVLREHTPKRINVGPVWTIVQLESAQAVLALRPDFARMAGFDTRSQSTGIVVYGAYGADGADSGDGADRAAAIEVRAFAPSVGVNEDPVCGSGNGCVAAFIRDAGQIGTFGSEYVATQGTVVGRAGKLIVRFEGDRVIRVGGQSVTCVDGMLNV